MISNFVIETNLVSSNVAPGLIYELRRQLYFFHFVFYLFSSCYVCCCLVIMFEKGNNADWPYADKEKDPARPPGAPSSGSGSNFVKKNV